MIELPEVVTIARQIRSEFVGKRIEAVSIAEERPKFMFLNEDLDAYEGNVCGIGNGYLQDILFRAKLSPKRKVPDISPDERMRLRGAIAETMTEAIEKGGRDTERDLYGRPGRYVPILDRRAVDTPCPDCGTPIEKMSYLGGSCYVCPSCQPAP